MLMPGSQRYLFHASVAPRCWRRVFVPRPGIPERCQWIDRVQAQSLCNRLQRNRPSARGSTSAARAGSSLSTGASLRGATQVSQLTINQQHQGVRDTRRIATATGVEAHADQRHGRFLGQQRLRSRPASGWTSRAGNKPRQIGRLRSEGPPQSPRNPAAPRPCRNRGRARSRPRPRGAPRVPSSGRSTSDSPRHSLSGTDRRRGLAGNSA